MRLSLPGWQDGHSEPIGLLFFLRAQEENNNGMTASCIYTSFFFPEELLYPLSYIDALLTNLYFRRDLADVTAKTWRGNE